MWIFIWLKIVLPGKYAAKREMNDPPLLTFGDWMHALCCVENRNSLFGFSIIAHSCSRSAFLYVFVFTLTRARSLSFIRYLRPAYILLLIISHGEVYARDDIIAAHMTMQKTRQTAHLLYVCIWYGCVCLHVPNNFRYNLRERGRGGLRVREHNPSIRLDSVERF